MFYGVLGVPWAGGGVIDHVGLDIANHADEIIACPLHLAISYSACRALGTLRGYPLAHGADLEYNTVVVTGSSFPARLRMRALD